MAAVDFGSCNPYMILGRIVQDNKYFLQHPHIKHLWACNVTDQIDTMKSIWLSFSEDDKPEWLSWEEVLDYEKKLLEVEKALQEEKKEECKQSFLAGIN